jgi:hypothetical protein
MRSQVQVLAGPPPIPAGQSAVGSEPGALAGCLGRAGAARPSPAGTLIGPSGPIHPRVGRHDHHPPWSPTQPRAAATRPVRQPRAAACSRPSRSRQRRALRTPAWPAGSLSGQARPPPSPTRPGSATDTPLTEARPRQPRPRPGPSAVNPAARGRSRPPGPRPVPVQGAPPHRPGPQRHRLTWEETDASGRTAGHRTAGHRTAGHRTRTTEPDGWTPHGGRGSATDAMAGVLAWSTTATTPDRCVLVGRFAGQTPSGRSANQDSSGKAYQDGPGHRRERQLQVLLRRLAGASAHCCPRTISGRG